MKNVSICCIAAALFLFSILCFTTSLSAQDIDVQVSIVNPISGCTNAIDENQQCPIYKCQSVVQVKLLVTANSQAGTIITQNLPSSAIVVTGSAKVNNVSVSSNCPSSADICFTSQNGEIKWTFPTQTVITNGILEYQIVFDCNNTNSQNGNALKTSWTGGNRTDEIEYSLNIIQPEIEIRNLAPSFNALLNSTNERVFIVCAKEGVINGFELSYIPETEITPASPISLEFSGNGNTKTWTV